MTMATLALKLLLRKVDRTAITILMLVPIVTLLVGSNLLITGYAHETQSSLSFIPSGEVYIAYSASSNGNLNASSLAYGSFQAINGSGVRWALPFLEKTASVGFDGKKFNDIYIVGTDIHVFENAKEPQVFYASQANRSISDGEIAIGAILSKITGISLNDTIQVSIGSVERNFTVNAIMNSTSQYDTMLILPLNSFWSSYPETGNSVSYVEFQNSSQISVPNGMHVAEEGNLGVIASSFASDTTNLVNLWTFVMLALVAVAAVVASFRIVSGSTLEFDILWALGSRKVTASGLLIYQLATVCACSVIIGIAGGVVATQIFSTFIGTMLHAPILPAIDPTQLASFALYSFVLMFAAGFATIAAFLVRRGR